MIRVDARKYPKESCWQIACDESKLSRHVPILMPLGGPSISDVVRFCDKHFIPHNFRPDPNGDPLYELKSEHWPDWLDLPWRNIVVISGHGILYGGHAVSIHSESQYDRMRRFYPFCYGVIDVGAFAVDCYNYISSR